LSPRQVDRLGADVVSRVNAAMKLPAAGLPTYPRKRAPRLPRMAPERIRRLKIWRDGEAERLKLDPSVVCTKAQITEVAVRESRNPSKRSPVANFSSNGR
jgi:ribonuclease D